MADPCNISINLVSGPTRGTFHSIVFKEIQRMGMKFGRLQCSSFFDDLGSFRNAYFTVNKFTESFSTTLYNPGTDNSTMKP